MPTKARRLKEEALQACKNRGHAMSNFFRPYITVVKVKRSEKIWQSYCKNCGKGVCVNLKPLPNEIDIAGEAVALNCLGVKK